MAELDGVLHQVAERGAEQHTIGQHHQGRIHERHDEPQTLIGGVSPGVDLDVLHERCHLDRRETAASRLEPDLGERTVDEHAEAPQVASQRVARTAAHADPAQAQELVREPRGVDRVPELVRQHPQPLVLVAREGGLTAALVLRHGLGRRHVTHQLKAWNSDTVIGWPRSSASSVTTWQTSP